jgi:TQXA domain-containing protein
MKGRSRVVKCLGYTGILLMLMALVAVPVLADTVKPSFSNPVRCDHPELPEMPGMPGVYATLAMVFKLEVTRDDGTVETFWAYCEDLGTPFGGEGLGEKPDEIDPKALWILHHYYPVTDMPAGLETKDKAAAVQLAIWHFTSGFDFMDDGDGTPAHVFAAAREIVAAANASGWESLPATLTLDPASAINFVGADHQVTATVLDEAGNPMAGVLVEFTVSGANSAGPAQIVTGADGTAAFTYSGANGGQDVISAAVAYDAPSGLKWGGYDPKGNLLQDLIAASYETRHLSATATKLWEERVGGQGCTPGYWKQKQHFDSWPEKYDPDTSNFAAVFGVNVTKDNNVSLLKALGTGGGGEKALLRHATAALLNASKSGLRYYYSEDEVISIVQEAYRTGNFEQAKNLFERQNEAGCPLN